MCASSSSSTDCQSPEVTKSLFLEVLSQMKTTAGGPEQSVSAESQSCVATAEGSTVPLFQASMCLMSEVCDQRL